MPPGIFAIKLRVVTLQVLATFHAGLAVYDCNTFQTGVGYPKEWTLAAELLILDYLHF